ncbi:hypothetical protein VNO77_13799 [Canavalia gladiata]|uniref:BHLH domain-containing protein n=1 Tax=Canavalia gladiata TaxID=3824 RepID=A0AAN9QQQ0_CANGL
MADSTRPGMTRSSSFLDSIYGNGSLELVWDNGQIHVQGGSTSSFTPKTLSCDGYPIKASDEGACIAKNARLSPLYSLMDLPVQRDNDLDLDHSQRNSHQNNDHNSSQLDFGFSKNKSLDKAASYVLGSASTQQWQCLPSSPIKKPRTDSGQTPATKSQNQELGQVNHSNVLGPLLFLNSTFQGNSPTLPRNKASNVAIAAASSSKAPDHSMVIDSSKVSHGLTRFEGENPLISDASNPLSFFPRSQEAPPDEHSEAVGHNSALAMHAHYHNQTSSSTQLRPKGKADINYADQPLLDSSSLCSLGASNNANICFRKHADTDDSTYLSDNDEEPEDAVKEKPAQEGTRVKRMRNAESHNLCERKRRDKINKRMRILKELIPNCNKMDKASMLDDAIEYLKSLKLQLQIMSMGAGFCMPLMMLPTATPHMINSPHLHHLMGAGMGFRPGTTIPVSLPQFPITPLPSITDNRSPMFGFPNQVPPIPISHAPFIPMVGNLSTQPFLATTPPTNVAENLVPSQLTTLKASPPNNSYLNEQSGYATNQAPNQVSLHH